MPYMETIEVLNDVEENVITGLTTVLRNGASIRDEGGAPKPNLVRKDLVPPQQQ